MVTVVLVGCVVYAVLQLRLDTTTATVMTTTSSGAISPRFAQVNGTSKVRPLWPYNLVVGSVDLHSHRASFILWDPGLPVLPDHLLHCQVSTYVICSPLFSSLRIPLSSFQMQMLIFIRKTVIIKMRNTFPYQICVLLLM